MFLSNKYKRWYYQIVDKARKRGVIEDYFEKHHVVPRCMGGTNAFWNLVNLTFREHFLAHWLLTKCVSDPYCHKMKHALHRLCKGENGQIRTSWQYALAKKLHLEAIQAYWTDEKRKEFGEFQKKRGTPVKLIEHLEKLNGKRWGLLSDKRKKELELRNERKLARNRGEKLPLTKRQIAHLDKLARLHKERPMTEKHAAQLHEIQQRPKTERQKAAFAKGQEIHISNLRKDPEYRKKVITPLLEWYAKNGRFRKKVEKRNKLGLKGVTQRSKSCFSSTIIIAGKSIRLGYFKTAEEASVAYWQAAEAHFGEFARG